MNFLHPIFLVIFAMLFYVFIKGEDLGLKNTKFYLFLICILLIIGAGGRYFVGADYPVYKSMYETGFPLYTTYGDIWDKATFQPNTMEIEWLFVLINKIVFDLGFPYYVLTFILATISITLLYQAFTNNSPFPALSFLFYFMAIYFYSDCGQMRQGLGTAFCVYSIKFIIERKMWKFLLCMFLALGMHKSAVIFIPAYWIALLPFNANKWIGILVIGVILAPFEVYTLFGGVISAVAPSDVSNAYEGYSNDTYYGNALSTGFGDVINILFIILLFVYDKHAQKQVPYYEYFRNLAYFGYFLYYIFRGNEIFATRLPGPYISFAGYFAAPAIFISAHSEVKRMLQLGYISFFLFIYVIFSNGNGKRGGFTSDRYRNILWSQTDG